MERDRWGKWLVAGGLAVVVIAGVLLFVTFSRRSVAMVVGSQPVVARVSDTEAEREQGLSGAPPLTDSQAMLFVFNVAARWGMWMKDMRYSLDIVWLNSDKQIIFIQQDVAPGTYPQVFQPKGAARYVIELPAGFVRRHGVGVGQAVSF